MSKKAGEMMDPGAPERAQGVAAPTAQRTSYAVEQFLSEVNELFPETGSSVDVYNGRNIGIGFSLDPTTLDNDDAILFLELIALAVEDDRVASVETDEETETVHVLLHNNPRLYDLRDPFGLDETLTVLAGDA